MENKPHDLVDALLDAALDRYVSAEPLNGLEERILNRVIVEHSGIRFPYGRSLLAIGATLALLCLFRVSFQQHRTEPKRQVPALARVESRLPPRISLPPRRQTRVRYSQPLPRLPKREQFPTFQPPSAEERALLRFIERDPNEAAQASASLQRQMDAPLEIQPLEIKPLQTDEWNN